jgi:predicted phage terminase large subunit-like protein
MLSRNRSTCGIRPYVRCTTNPDADSWVAELIAWWIDQDTGLPIAERGGRLRYFARIADTLVWGDSAAELQEQYAGCEPKSLTFIPAKLEDNAILMAADPGYRANLLALPLVDRERLLGGNWKIRPAAGLYFRRGWVTVVDAVPTGTRFVRGWDLAATPKTENNDPDWTAGCKIGRVPDGRFIVAHHTRARSGPKEVERLLTNTASADGKPCRIALPQDPGQAGKSQAQHLASLLVGYDIRIRSISGDKVTRFAPFSAQAEAGNVIVLRGPWNEDWFTALESFSPDAAHDDDADATAEAFNALIEEPARPVFGTY